MFLTDSSEDGIRVQRLVGAKLDREELWITFRNFTGQGTWDETGSTIPDTVSPLSRSLESSLGVVSAAGCGSTGN